MTCLASTQGIAFMNRYKVLRREADSTALAETNFNIARAYHGLGEGVATPCQGKTTGLMKGANDLWTFRQACCILH
jgi:hypothetical protein